MPEKSIDRWFFHWRIEFLPNSFSRSALIGLGDCKIIFKIDELSAISIVSYGDEAMDFEAALALYVLAIRDRASCSVLVESPWSICQYSTASDSIALNVSHSGTLVSRPCAGQIASFRQLLAETRDKLRVL